MCERYVCGMGFTSEEKPIRIIHDNVEDKDYYLFADLCKIMNEQQDIIQSLRKDIMEMSDNHQSYIELESETKSKVNDIIRTQRIEIRKLSEENRELRKELDNFKPVMFQDARKGTVILYSKGD